MARIEYSNGAHLTTARQKVMLHTVRFIEQPNGDSPKVASTITEQQFNELAKDVKRLGGRYNAQRFIFPIEQLDAVKEIAESMWGEPVQPEPANESSSSDVASEAPIMIKPELAPQPQLEIYEGRAQSASGLSPWQAGESHNWFVVNIHSAGGVGVTYARRTASAHEVGRMILRRYPQSDAVEVLDEGYAVLARITDPAPACEAIQRIEQDVEIARRARHELDAALRRLKVSVSSAHGEDDDGHKKGHSGNELAALVKGAASRPTVLKWLQIDADEANLV